MMDETNFLQDVAKHEVIVERDDGVYRHITFKRPGTACMQFSIITWPGSLCCTGDMGTYVFQRLHDMFEFFRTDREAPWLKRQGLTLGINQSYWGEKLQAVDRHDGFRKFSDEKFRRSVMGDLVRWIRNHRDQTTKYERRELWDAVVSVVIGADGDSDGCRQQIAAHDFSHQVNRRLTFSFTDFWEHDVCEYSHRFLWCCYALAWGIKKYDDAKKSMVAA